MARGNDERHNPNRRPTNPNLTPDGKIDSQGLDWWNRASNMSNMAAETYQMAAKQYADMSSDYEPNSDYDEWLATLEPTERAAEIARFNRESDEILSEMMRHDKNG